MSAGTQPEITETWRDRLVEVVKMRAGDILPHPHNPKVHPPAQTEPLKGLLSEVGKCDILKAYRSERMNGALVYWDGHAREGLNLDEHWQVGIYDISDREADLLVASFDPLRALAETDKVQLDALLRDVSTSDAAVSQMLSELAEENGLYFGESKPPVVENENTAAELVDRAAELQAKWKVAEGQIYEFESIIKPGNVHRLICGDSTDANLMAEFLGTRKPACVVTDPPYSFGLSSTKNRTGKSSSWHDLMNNAAWFTSRYKQYMDLIGSGPIWMFTNWRTLPTLMRAGYDSAAGIGSVMVWYKDWIGPGGSVGLRPTYELIALSTIGEYAIPDRGVEDFVKVPWSSHKPHGHQAEKPVDLFARLIEISECDSVFEPFAGVGSCIVAAEQMGVECYAAELSESYCAMALERLHLLSCPVRRVN